MSWNRIRSTILIFGLMGLLPGLCLGQRLTVPDGVFYYEPASAVFGSQAAWVNPAGLAAYKASSFQFIADYSDREFAKSWGMAVNREQLGFAYRRLDTLGDNFHSEYVFAAGISLGPQLHVGGSYRYFKEAAGDLHRRHLWNIGLTGGAGNLRWAAVFENLNRARNTEGRRTETEQRYAVSCRPLGKTLTISAEMALSTGTRLSNADYIYHAELATKQGLYLNGCVTSDGAFQLGLRANLLKYFVGSRSSFESDGDYGYSTLYYGATSIRQPSIISPKERRLAITVSGSPRENPPRPIFGPKRSSFTSLTVSYTHLTLPTN